MGIFFFYSNQKHDFQVTIYLKMFNFTTPEQFQSFYISCDLQFFLNIFHSIHRLALDTTLMASIILLGWKNF